jgi:hypothetical protein
MSVLTDGDIGTSGLSASRDEAPVFASTAPLRRILAALVGLVVLAAAAFWLTGLVLGGMGASELPPLQLSPKAGNAGVTHHPTAVEAPGRIGPAHAR